MRANTFTWLVLGGAWLLYALVQAGQFLSMRTVGNEAIPLALALELSLIGVAPWVPLSYGLIWAVRRFDLAQRPSLLRSLALAVVGVIAAILVRAVWVAVLNSWLGHWYPTPPSFWRVLADSARNNVLPTLVLVGLAHAWGMAQVSAANRRRILALEAGLNRARLESLAAQLRPHFLFNTLNAIAELIHQDPVAAERMLLDLSALLRRSLATGAEAETTLDEELQSLAHFVAIARQRFGSRFDYVQNLEGGSARVRVPALLLQPLLENAVIHGVAKRRGMTRVELRIWREGERLRLELVNDLALGADAAPRADGIGLANTLERLRCLHGDAATLVCRHEDGRHVLQLSLPWREMPSPTVQRTPALERAA